VENFNNHFLTIAENISCKITGSHKQLLIVLNTHYLIHLRYLIFSLPIVFSTILLQGKLKKFTPSLGKIHVGIMKFQQENTEN